MKNWGFFIKQLREERGLSQADLAQRSGLLASHISRIESGAYKSPKQDTFERLAYGLNLTPTQLSQIIKGKASSIPKETPEEILQRFNIALPSSVPIYEDFPFHAGKPVEPMDYIPVVKDRARRRNLEGYIVRGSCLRPQIEDKDVIIIDRDAEIAVGDIVACLADGMMHLAKLRRIAGELYLEDNNHRMKLEETQVAAPVIEVRRRLK